MSVNYKLEIYNINSLGVLSKLNFLGLQSFAEPPASKDFHKKGSGSNGGPS